MKETNRQILPCGLWVVATPIGNLADISSRAISALKEADLILCEDTRRTGALLSALGIAEFKGRLERVDSYAESQKLQFFIEKMKAGKNLALVTDAGTPAISDPGSALVACAHEAGICVTPLPGASAVVTLLSVSGFQGTAFTFRGFFPRKLADQKEELQWASISPLSSIYVWFESPQRIEETLTMLSETFPQVPVVIGKELTKLHERIFFDQADPVAKWVQNEIATEGKVGEWCFAIQFPKQNRPDYSMPIGALESAGWDKALQCLLDAHITVSEAAKRVSQSFGIPKKVSYEMALKVSGKKVKGGD